MQSDLAVKICQDSAATAGFFAHLTNQIAVKGTVSVGSSVGEYLVRYVPVVAGRCKLDVQLEGEGIDQSPFTVTVASGTQTRLLRLVITCVRDE